MDSGQRDLPISLSEVLHTRSGPLCISLNSSSAKVRLDYPDPGTLAVDAFLQDWSKWTCLIHPPVALLPRILRKIREDQATALLIAPNWSGQPWFPELLFPSLSANCAPPSVAVAASRSLAIIRNRYETTGFSKEVVDILLASRTATQKQYAGPWKAWVHWCSQRSICPISAPVAEVLAFLASLVTHGIWNTGQ